MYINTEWVYVREYVFTNTGECGSVSQAGSRQAGSKQHSQFVHTTAREREKRARATRKEFFWCIVYMEKVFSEFCCRRKHAVLRSKYQFRNWSETSRCLATSLLFINSKSAAGTVCVWYGNENKYYIEFPYTLNHSVCDSATSNNANLFWTLPT